MVVARIGFQAATRAATCALLRAYADDAAIKLQVYEGRPRSINPPCAFVDRLVERITYPGSVTWRQRNIAAEVLVLHGTFDSLEAVTQKDAFVDSFLDWVTDDVHAIAANTVVGVTVVEDVPDYVNDWAPPEQQRNYYATRITLEGFAGG